MLYMIIRAAEVAAVGVPVFFLLAALAVYLERRA